MQSKYPIMDIVKQKLAEMGKNYVWLGQETGRTDRWYYNEPTIDKIEFQILEKLSKALQFDFIADYRRFMGDNTELIPAVVSDVNESYITEEKRISIQMTLSGTVTTFQKSYLQLLQLMLEEGKKLGFEIE